MNIVDPRLLKNLCTMCKTYRNMNAASKMSGVGFHEGFFDCMACDTCPTSIISLADVDDLY